MSFLTELREKINEVLMGGGDTPPTLKPNWEDKQFILIFVEIAFDLFKDVLPYTGQQIGDEFLAEENGKNEILLAMRREVAARELDEQVAGIKLIINHLEESGIQVIHDLNNVILELKILAGKNRLAQKIWEQYNKELIEALEVKIRAFASIEILGFSQPAILLYLLTNSQRYELG